MPSKTALSAASPVEKDPKGDAKSAPLSIAITESRLSITATQQKMPLQPIDLPPALLLLALILVLITPTV
ncbi:hypothetical protein [Rivularia sp. PCC 7116]|uniref:hypothetical protein n=1 Tax=Rivularia sp. PCC 7116 TaxID=373994 RepID=UPI0002E1BFF8|nr:hypothetical protein [Rivularia sp. PCC 7116]